MNDNLEREGTDKGTAELNPYYRYATYVPSKLVGTRSYWASRHLDLTAMSRELGKADLFITFTMNDSWADLTAAVQKGCRAGAVWPGEYPKNTGPNKPIQDGHDMEACVAFHKRVEIFKREFLAIVHLERCGIIGFDLNIKSEAGCICMAWYGVKPTAYQTMWFAQQCPVKVTALIQSSQHTYGICTRSATWCINATPTSVSILVVGVYAPSASQVIPLVCRKREKNWMTVESACFIADMKPKMHVLFHTIANCWFGSSATIMCNE